MGEYLSVRDAARILGVHEQTIYRKLWRGEFEGVVRVGRAIRIPCEALTTFPEYAPPAHSERG